MTHQAELAENVRLIRVRTPSFIDQAAALAAIIAAAAASDERVAAALADAARDAAHKARR